MGGMNIVHFLALGIQAWPWPRGRRSKPLYRLAPVLNAAPPLRSSNFYLVIAPWPVFGFPKIDWADTPSLSDIVDRWVVRGGHRLVRYRFQVVWRGHAHAFGGRGFAGYGPYVSGVPGQ